MLVGSFAGVGVAAPLTTGGQAVEATERPGESNGVTAVGADAGTPAAQQGGQVNVSEVNVSALEAVQLVENRTEGKAIGVRLVTADGGPAFNVTVLRENRSLTQFTVDATEPTVTAVRRNVTVLDTQFLGGDAFVFEELRSAAEAIQVVQNATEGTNATVVNVGLQRGVLAFGVSLRTPEGAQTRAFVAATDEPLLALQTMNATPPTGNATTPEGNSS